VDAFLNQTEAWNYVGTIADARERLLTEYALARALSFLVTDPSYPVAVAEGRAVDLLVFARTVHALFEDTDVIRRIIDGDIESIDVLSPFPHPEET
jgi:hypothetical protein